MITIIAPHVDDEVIGCWSVLSNPSARPLRVYYTESADPERTSEAFKLLESLGIGGGFLAKHRLASIGWETNDQIILAPDPHWELHPVHKAVGAEALALARTMCCRFISYSTNMNVPYLRELNAFDRHQKKQMLDQAFPSQASLWAYDHRYFLFEGLCEWDPRV
jgi:hypothetical protein